MAESILTSIKKMLNIHETDTNFDMDVLIHINGAFSTLHQLGIGPENGFAIADATTTWTSFIGTDQRYNSVINYVYFKTRLGFDPPPTSYGIQAMEKMAEEIAWRLNVVYEGDNWVGPDPTPDPTPLPPVLDGGTP